MPTHHRPYRRIASASIVASLTLSACAASGTDTSLTSGDDATRSAGADLDGQAIDETPLLAGASVPSIISLAFKSFGFLKKCLDNREEGAPCLASDTGTIRKTLEEVKALRATIDRNQQQVLAEFDSIRNLIRDQNIRSLAVNLRPMVVNAELASRAYEALAECAVSSGTTCRPFIGRDGDPPIAAAEAISKTRDYLLEKAANLPVDLPVTASWFTGTSPRFDDGLADAIWMFNKGRQDVAAGVTNAAVKNSPTVPVVTRSLADETNQDLAYWADAFGQYAFLAVMYAGFSGGERVAERRQAEADSYIASTTGRRSVLGTVNHYSLPGLPTNGVILTDGRTAWLVTTASRAGRPLTPEDLIDLSRIVSSYAPFDSFTRIPNALPADGWYHVRTPIERARYEELLLTGRDMALAQEWTGVDAAWLVDSATASDHCSSRVRPTAQPQRPNYRGPDFRSTSFPIVTDPAFTPPDRTQVTWEQLAFDKPIEYTWSTLSWRWMSDKELGWGAWIECVDAAPGSLVTLLKVPPVMAPAR